MGNGPSEYRPIEALDLIAPKDENEKAQLAAKLSSLPSFDRIEEDALYQLAAKYPNVINITGYSGQGVHEGQLKLLELAFPAILQDMGWSEKNTLVISGGTNLGIPHVAVTALSVKHEYPAIGVMAMPGVAYPMSPGYEAICVDNDWKDWGSETLAMARASNGTVLVGGGTQALTDALLALRDDEPIAVIVNCYNGMSRIPYRLGEIESDVIMRNDPKAPSDEGVFNIGKLYATVSEELRKQGVPEEKLGNLRVMGVPISGLVTELKKGERRQCAQDLLYFAVTGENALLPKEFQGSTEETEKLRQRLVERVGLYYLLDDPSEGIFGSAVCKVNDSLTSDRLPFLEKVIDHAVQHDVTSASGFYGPACLGAKSAEQLSDLLKAALRQRVLVRESKLSA